MGRKKKVQSVNHFLRDLRIREGKTQMDTARFLGHTTAQYVSNLERELCDASVEMAARLCEFYGGNRMDLYEILVRNHRAELDKRFVVRTAKKAA